MSALFVGVSAMPQAQEKGEGFPPSSFADLVEKLSPAVVNISTTQKIAAQAPGIQFPELPNRPEFDPFRQFFERFAPPGGEQAEREVYSLGSGFIIDPQGYIITNNHVIDEAEEIHVRMSDDSKFDAKVIGRDKKTDLALLKVEPSTPLPYVMLGDSDAVRVGDWVVAIGNPYGLGGSVTQGIISARQRSINAGPFDDFLQTDASINRGNSGGPLFNMQGEVIGINSAIFSPSGGNIGIGFAIPTSLAKPVISQLREFGRTHRGWLGVKIQQVTDEVADSVGLPEATGALVLEVTPDGPAQKAGIEAGDIITVFDATPVKEMRFLPRLVAETKIGKTVEVELWRGGRKKTMRVTLGELEEAETEEAKAPPGGEQPGRPANARTLLSMQVAALTPSLREEYGLVAGTEGLLVVDVEARSEASRRGMRRGDVITEISGTAVKTPEEAMKALALAKKAGRNYALLKVQRGKEAAFVTLPVEEKKE